MTADLREDERPRVSGAVSLTAQQAMAGEHLAMIHAHFLAQVANLLRLVEAVANDERSLAELADEVQGLEMRRNYEAVGSFCGSVCYGLNAHHSIEDRFIFPEVSASALYAPVIAKLREEHEVIHAQLERLDAAMDSSLNQGSPLHRLTAEVERLQGILISHFGYEDEQLPEPLGVLDLPV